MALKSGGSPQGSPRTAQTVSPTAAPDSPSLRGTQASAPGSPKRGPSFSAKNEKQAALFQKSLSQEGLLNFIRNESVARALQESSGAASAQEGDEFTENPFLLRNPTVVLNTWEIHVSNDEKPPLVSSIKVQQPLHAHAVLSLARLQVYLMDISPNRDVLPLHG